MLAWDVILEAVVYLVAAAVTTLLYRRFRRAGSDALSSLLAAVGISFGLMLGVSGVLHTIAVAAAAIARGSSYDLRLAWLMVTGAILMYFGASHVLLARWIHRGYVWAMGMSLMATIALVLFFVALYPAKSETTLLLLSGGYLVLTLTWFNRYMLYSGTTSSPKAD